MAVTLGGSGQIQFTAQADGPADYDIQLSVTGLPPGTTAAINPQTIIPGQTTTVTITAASTAPETQNATVTLTGTPSAQAAAASTTFLADVTPPPGSLPGNRTDYLSTVDTPSGAVYDPVHQLIFASNLSWNRVDVISTVTHAIVSHIPLPVPQAMDISQDDSTVWVGTGSRQVFAIDTASLAVTRYLLPAGPTSPASVWQASDRLFHLADGTLMIVWDSGIVGSEGIAIWNPATNAITFPTAPQQLINDDIIQRSGDGNLVYFISGDSGGDAYSYNVATQTFSAVAQLGGYAVSAAVNMDGSRFFVCDANGPNLYDGSFNLVGPAPACPGGPTFQGGSVFSSDNQYLYQEALGNIPAIIKLDLATMNVVSVAPAMPMIPVLTELSPPYYVPIPFAVDSTGMVFGIQDSGISFDDGAFSQNYSALDPGTPVYLQHMIPYFGPLAGGTTSGGFGNAFSITPDVWYGANRGKAAVDSAGDLTITSPPASTPGPVNVKMLFPDGIEVFDPQFFSYGPDLQYALESGAPPQGNVPAQVVGYGLPGDGITGSLTIGGATAALQSPSGSSGLPFTGTPFPNKILSYTVPPGTPGWTDITVTTPDGASTLPKSFFYAKGVTDYPSTDSFTAVLYDAKRQQLYLSAGDHIDVFSLTSNQFVAPLNPPAIGTSKLFAGLTLTPDGSLLLATDLQDGSLAVISPDTPANAYTIPIAPVGTNGNANCTVGPLYVAATSNNQAMVVTGGIAGIGCGPGGKLYLANLTSKTAGPPPPSAACSIASAGYPGYVAATPTGDKIAIGGSESYDGFCIYNPVTQTYVSNSYPGTAGAAFSGDGQVAASEMVFTDASAHVVGLMARPYIYFHQLITSAQMNLQEPQFNASGSLYYMAYPDFIDLIDVLHSTVRLRFALSETVRNTAAPMAIDSTGRFIYLITNQGLTIVDLGQAPLSIGWLNPATASPGTQVTVRGSGFDSSTTATVDGQAASVTLVDPSTLNLTIPSVSAGPATIVLKNGDGTTYTAATLLTVQ